MKSAKSKLAGKPTLVLFVSL